MNQISIWKTSTTTFNKKICSWRRKINNFWIKSLLKNIEKNAQTNQRIKNDRNQFQCRIVFFLIIFSFFELTINHQFNFDVQIFIFEKLTKIIFIIDIKTFVKKFVNVNFVKKYRISTIIITKKVNLKLVDDFTKHALTQITSIKIQLKNHVDEILYLITSLNKFDIIFKMFWMKKHKINIKKTIER